MTKSKRLKPVAKIAENKERDAARMLGDCQRVLKEHEARLEELITYRQEYTEHFQQLGKEGLPAGKAHEYRAFLHQLNLSIENQRERVESTQQELEEKKRYWTTVRSRAKALEKVVSNHIQQETRLEARKEQRESDEQAQHIKRTISDPKP